MTMTSLDSQWTLSCLLLLFLANVASAVDVRNMTIDEYVNYINPPAVYKFQNKHGDTILCVLYADQISLQGTEQPSMETKADRKTKSGLNSGNKTECPEGTVTILETKREHVERAGSVTSFISKRKSIRRNLLLDSAQHEHARVSFTTGAEKIHGASAGLNVWKPYLDTDDSGIFTLTQIWLVNDHQPLETIEIGWAVYPSMFGDLNTRFFVFWTADGYKSTGCWNTNCPGFVLAPSAYVYPGEPLSPVSTYNGGQQQIILKVIKENPTGKEMRWNLYINNRLSGWWPISLFKNLQSNANRVDVGGEVAFYKGSKGFPRTDMGSGHFPPLGFGRSAHIRDIKIMNDHGVSINIPGNVIASKPKCYDVSFPVENQLGKHIFFGGPGGDYPYCVL